MRDDYLKSAQQIIPDANILINVVSTRVKQLRRGHRPLVESLERLSPEDTALREIAEGRIGFELQSDAALARTAAARRAFVVADRSEMNGATRT